MNNKIESIKCKSIFGCMTATIPLTKPNPHIFLACTFFIYLQEMCQIMQKLRKETNQILKIFAKKCLL